MTFDLQGALWTRGDVHRGLELLLATAGHDVGSTEIPAAPMVSDVLDNEWLRVARDWLVNASRPMGLEGSVETSSKQELLARLTSPGPFVCVLACPGPSGGRGAFLVALGEGLRCRVLSPSGRGHVVSPAALEEAIDAWTDKSGRELAAALTDLPGARRAVAELYGRAQLDAIPFTVVRYRRDGASTIVEQLDALRGRRLVWGFAALAIAELAVTVAASLTLGRSAVEGLVDRGRILAWAMLSLASVPLTYWSASMVGSLTVLGGAAVKRRLLEGALFVDDRSLRTQGYGATLARLNEATVIERTNLSELFALLAPLAMWIGASWVFLQTHLAGPLLAVQACAFAVTLFVGVRLVRTYRTAYAQRLALTEDMIEKIVGHRTRAIQESSSHRHDAEDRALAAYTATLGRLDRLAVLSGAAPRAFVLASGGILAVAFTRGASPEELLAPGVGIFLGMYALGAIASVLEHAAGWLSAWKAIAPLFQAGRQRDRRHDTAEVEAADGELPTVLAASAVSFAYKDGGRLILKDADLRIRRGERVLVEGPSGGGKTTLAKLIAGELRPSSGSILVGGLDCVTVAQSQWREIVASAPQFHENHVFSNSLVFNLDPKGGPSGSLSEQAAEICEELGLSEVMSRMPAGAAQLLGESGWQLSHGERSRVFIARALLQGARLVIFDESFGALDPVTLERAVRCVRRHASTLVVIAHV